MGVETMDRNRYLVPLLLGAVILGGALFLAGPSVFARLLPYGLFLLCPLMHVFMMHGLHGGQHQPGNCHEKAPAQLDKRPAEQQD